MDAGNHVARLIVDARRQISSQPARERIIDPLDGAVLVDQQHADVHHVEDRAELRVGGFQLAGALLDQFLQVMAMFFQFRFGPLALGDVACRQATRAEPSVVGRPRRRRRRVVPARPMANRQRIIADLAFGRPADSPHGLLRAR